MASRTNLRLLSSRVEGHAFIYRIRIIPITLLCKLACIYGVLPLLPNTSHLPTNNATQCTSKHLFSGPLAQVLCFLGTSLLPFAPPA